MRMNTQSTDVLTTENSEPESAAPTQAVNELPSRLYYRQSLADLARLKRRHERVKRKKIEKAKTMDEGDKVSKAKLIDPTPHDAAISKIGRMATFRGLVNLRCSLPKKKQRELGLIPQLETK